MKKNARKRTPQMTGSLERRLTAYSAAAGAMLLVAAPANAAKFKQTVGLTVTPASSPNLYIIEMPSGTRQFVLHAHGFLGGRMRLRATNGSATTNPLSHSWRVVNTTTGVAYGMPETYDAGAAVSAQTKGATWGRGTNTLNIEHALLCWKGPVTATAATTTMGNWCGVNDKYIKLRFNDGSGVQYSWIRLDVAADASSFTLDEFGWSDTALEAINTLADGLRKARLVSRDTATSIQWSMHSEEGLASYRVEKSSGGQWQLLGIKLAGSGEVSYSVTDSSPAAGDSYRVVATAVNGQQTVFDVP